LAQEDHRSGVLTVSSVLLPKPLMPIEEQRRKHHKNHRRYHGHEGKDGQKIPEYLSRHEPDDKIDIRENDHLSKIPIPPAVKEKSEEERQHRKRDCALHEFSLCLTKFRGSERNDFYRAWSAVRAI